MNYKKIYNSIMEKRLCEIPLDEYTEKHHIKPKSLGGGNDKSNLVSLTAREHFIAHCLLVKIYKKETFEWYKMNHAFMMMKYSSLNQNRYFNGRLYASLKCNFSKVRSESQKGSLNSQYGTMWITNKELEENKKIPKNSDIPIGWEKGRTKYVELNKKIIYYTRLVNSFNSHCLWEKLQEEYNLDDDYTKFRIKARKYSKVKMKTPLSEIYSRYKMKSKIIKHQKDRKIFLDIFRKSIKDREFSVDRFKLLYDDFTNNYEHGMWIEFKNKHFIKNDTLDKFKRSMKTIYKPLITYRIQDKIFYNKNKYKLEVKRVKEYYTKLYNIRKKTTSKRFIEITGYDKKVSNLPIFFKKYVDGYKP